MTPARNTERQQNVIEKERNGEEKKREEKNKLFLKIAEQQSLHANKKLREETRERQATVG